MKIKNAEYRDNELLNRLLKVWESSVKATHLFLSEDEISGMKPYVLQALKSVSILIVAENENKNAIGFMGIDGKRLEMLFISNENRGRKAGKYLLQYGIEKHGVNELTVNEQNPLAKGFYEHMGFKVYKRSEFDEQGNAYPLLYMKRK